VNRPVGYVWHLRQLMAAQGMFATTDLILPLAERGVSLSREQVYRLVAGRPERLNLTVLAALCDILGCGPGDLVEPLAGRRARTGTPAPAQAPAPAPPGRPRRARVLPAPGDQPPR
jgi:DNA-binding Xre family transcriptional regulator